MQTKKIFIKGMHCVACEKLLDDEFRNVADVKGVRVNRQTNSAEIDYDGQEPDFSEIKKIAEKYGYEVFENNPEALRGSTPKNVRTFDVSSWVKAALITAIMLFLYRVSKNFGLLDWLDVQSPNVTLGVAFLTGVVASVSTCLAVVGSVVIAFGEKYKSEGTGFYDQAFKPNFKFHLGRLISFFLLGGILGLIGGELSISGRFYFMFNILIAAVMAWLGLNILGILPAISNIGIRMPKFLTKHWDQLRKSEHKAAPFLLGGLSFFLPCGFTQSMQIFAVASGSFWSGSMILLLFALGTVPALLVIGITASWTQRKSLVFKKVAGFLIIIFAVYTFNSGWAMKDITGSVLSTKKQEIKSEKIKEENANNSAPKQDEQVVVMRITYNGFEPSTLRIKKDVPVKWIIKGDQVSGCTNQVIVPALKIEKDIIKGDNIIKFTPKEKGVINFSCWMGMVRGKFIVE